MLSFWLNSLVNFRQKKRNLELSTQSQKTINFHLNAKQILTFSGF